MRKKQGWTFNRETMEYVNDDYVYPLTVFEDTDGKFYAAVWVEYPDSWSPRTGGYPTDFNAIDVGSGFDTVLEAEETVEARVREVEIEFSKGEAVLEAMADLED